MKWYKHDSDERHNETASNIREKFGLEGLARWYIILEMIASKMEAGDDLKPEIRLSIREWMAALDMKREKNFREFAQTLTEFEGNLVNWSEMFCTISTPKLLFLLDEYTKKSRQKSVHSPKQSRVDIDKSRVDKEKTPIPPFVSTEKTEWNKLCAEIKILNKDTISKIGADRKKKLETRRSEPDFDFAAICNAIRACPQLQGQSTKGWVVSFDWLIDSEPHYQSILRQGRIARDHPSSNGQKQSIQPASAAKLQYEIDAEEEANLVKSGKMDISDATPQLRGLINSIINKGKA